MVSHATKTQESAFYTEQQPSNKGFKRNLPPRVDAKGKTKGKLQHTEESFSRMMDQNLINELSQLSEQQSHLTQEELLHHFLSLTRKCKHENSLIF